MLILYFFHCHACNPVEASISAHIEITNIFLHYKLPDYICQIRQQSFIGFPVSYEEAAFHIAFLLFW